MPREISLSHPGFYTMFDFYKTYSAYSNTALLKIITQPGLYQPEALRAAEQILQERNVSDADRAEADAEIATIIETENKPDAGTKIMRKIINAISYLFAPSETFDVRKWNYWLCILLLIMHGYSWLYSAQFMWRAITHDGYSAQWVLTELFPLLYIPGMIILLLLRDRVGWLMLIAYCGYEIIGRIYMFFTLRYLPGRLITAILIIGIYVLLLRFLAKPRVVIYFKGNYSLFKKAIAVGIIFALLFWVWISVQM